ncbi:serine hydrolase [Microseira wollei]|uniref:Beta-lactamase n=1 Tax=Microseira wollei NIES-4236 TaxID=2530354 RepID=A0AAV3XBI2_9CYAN|nr:serine hydrolase [Microseira wollei]GET36732.1 beta-lactamase [Microseira wollei NIES-4236]
MTSEQANNQGIASEMAAYLQAYLETGFFMGSVLVARAGEVLLSQGYGMANLEHSVANTPQTKFRLGSVTKQFTAAAILHLQQQGLLEVNSPLSAYLPDYPQSEQITVHHLLTHTAGIPNYTSFPDYVQQQRKAMTLDEVITWFSNKPLEFTPGDRHSYSNSGYAVLTKLIETVSDRSYADYLQHCIFEPLRMTDSGYDRSEPILSHRASGYRPAEAGYYHAEFLDMSIPVGAGALYSTVEDLYKWDQALYSDAILSETSRHAMFAPAVRIGEEDGDAFYGYGWVIDRLYERDRVAHEGGIDGFTTSLARFPSEQMVIIVLSNLVTAPVGKISNDLAAILWGEPYKLPKQRRAVELDPALYQSYVGDYELTPGVILTVTTEAQRIFTQLTGQERVEIFPESATEFFFKVVDAQLTFVVDETGKASRVVLHQGGRDHMSTRIVSKETPS